MIVDVDARSLSRVRVAASPASEVLSWLRLARGGRPHPVLGLPGGAARAALAHPDVRLVLQAVPRLTGYAPDMLTPKPPAGKAVAGLSSQLDLIEATPADAVRRQLRQVAFPGGRPPAQLRAAADAGVFARRAANGLHRFWRAALADWWPRLEVALGREVAARGALMAGYGIERVLSSLHPRIGWTGRQLRIDKPYQDVCHLDGAELVLAPSVVNWSTVVAQVCDPMDAVLVYPAGGAGTDLARRAAGGDEGMLRLVGRSRAAILRDLAVPRTTSELSARHALSPATVSYHLQALLDACLVFRTRDGHHVRYRRTDRGDALLGR